jgi:ABC-type polysaccharide transport system, permease component
MFGIVIAFKDYNIGKGIFNSEWIGFKWFTDFINSYYFVRLIRNTFLINGLKLLFVFPAPIIFALMMNEVRSVIFKKITQTVSYLPYFLSWVIIFGLIQSLFSPSMGLYGKIMSAQGLQPVNIFLKSEYFLPMIIGSTVWQSFGWGSIVYMAAIAGIDQELYEAAVLDGCGRFRQLVHVTLPGIKSLIVLFLLLNIGNILSVDFQQIIMFIGTNYSLYEVGDVIDTFVWRVGLSSGSFSYGTAIGLFKGVISLIMITLFNWVSKKAGEEGLW